MKMNQINKPKHTVTIIWMILLFTMFGALASDLKFGNQGAWADRHYGILGRQAPELNLNNWIDGDGKKIGPVRLSDYRGKVVYLYFFQNW